MFINNLQSIIPKHASNRKIIKTKKETKSIKIPRYDVDVRIIRKEF